MALDRGVLRVRVPDPSWQRSLLRLRADILRRLRRVAGRATPHALGFVAGGMGEPPPVLARAPEGRASAPPVVPALVLDAASRIQDAELRAGFLAAAGRYLDRFGGRGPGTSSGT